MPYRVLALALAVLTTAPRVWAQVPAGARDSSFASALHAYLTEQAARDAFSGAVLVARNGVPVFARAYGSADRARRVPNRLDTKFNLASIDKLLTRIAVWQLQQAGRLALDDTVGKHLPDYPNPAIRGRVTIRQLLDMSSGVGNFWNDRYLQRRLAVRTVDDYLDLFATDTLLFAPGTRRSYSNGGYIILGKIIERASGQSYYDYVRDHIATPAGMTSTRHYALAERVPNRAVGYTDRDSVDRPGADAAPSSERARERRPNTFSLAGRGSPAGGGYSTVEDFLRLDRALRADRLLRAAAGDSLLGPAFRSGTGAPVQYGGGGPGANAHFVMYPDGVTVIVFSNYDPPAATAVVRQIAQLLGKPPMPLRATP